MWIKCQPIFFIAQATTFSVFSVGVTVCICCCTKCAVLMLAALNLFGEGHDGALIGTLTFIPLLCYWGYRFIQNDISFLKVKDDQLRSFHRSFLLFMVIRNTPPGDPLSLAYCPANRIFDHHSTPKKSWYFDHFRRMKNSILRDRRAQQGVEQKLESVCSIGFCKNITSFSTFFSTIFYQ